MNCARHILAASLVAAMTLHRPAFAMEAGDAAPDFALVQRDAGTAVCLADCRGQIVVLDFFAYWCVPCARASAEVETGLRKYYEARNGNARGLPVRVLAVNIEAARPDKTDAFIKKAGLAEVLDDPQGEVFRRFGGSGTPFLVVIDCTGTETGAAAAKVVYRKAGFDGLPPLRQVIDGIGEPPTQPNPQTASTNPPAPVTSPGAEPAPATPTVISTPPPAAPAITPSPGISSTVATNPPDHLIESFTPPADAPANRVVVDSAFLFAADIWLTDTSVEYRRTSPGSDLKLSVSHGHIGIDFVPEVSLWQENHVNKESLGTQLRGRFDLGERLTLTAGGGAYEGYLDYRSLWLNEHFRQLYSGRSGYKVAEPWGGNAATGLRWEYLPAAGFVQADLAFQHDIISPGYEVTLGTFPPQLVRFRDDYDTVSSRLTLENVLTPRLRALQELGIISTTDRELRFSLQSSLNYAPGEHWVVRSELAGTREDPQFEAWHAGVTVERDWNETWFAGLMGRYYKDNGQIENALLAENTAAPPLETIQTGLSLRWQGGQSSLKLFAGPYFARYAAAGPSGTTFTHLYKDRDWFAVQFAFAREF